MPSPPRRCAGCRPAPRHRARRAPPSRNTRGCRPRPTWPAAAAPGRRNSPSSSTNAGNASSSSSALTRVSHAGRHAHPPRRSRGRRSPPPRPVAASRAARAPAPAPPARPPPGSAAWRRARGRSSPPPARSPGNRGPPPRHRGAGPPAAAAGSPAPAGGDRHRAEARHRHRIAARLALQQVGFAEEVRDEAGRRPGIDLGRGADLVQPAVVHHRDPVGHDQRLLLVMGDEERGQAEPALQPPDLELQPLPQLAVERAEGLVEQQQPRAEDHGAGERHPLLLPARELPRQPPASGPSSTSASASATRRGDLRLRPPPHLQREGDVLRDRQMREQRVILEDHARRRAAAAAPRSHPPRRAGPAPRPAPRSRRRPSAAWSCPSPRGRGW